MSDKDIEIDNVIVTHNLLSTPMENEKWIRIASPLLRELADEVERLREENKRVTIASGLPLKPSALYTREDSYAKD